MRTRLLLASSALATIVAGVWACSSTSSDQPLPVFDGDASTAVDSGGGADVAVSDSSTHDAADAGANVDAGDSSVAPDAARVLNNCGEADFVDRSGPDASRVIDFPLKDGGLGYAPPCMRIATGESVTWHGDFLVHPLGQFNGDDNSPIGSYDEGGGPDGSITIGFPEAGWYGFQCEVHASMVGAIQVK